VLAVSQPDRPPTIAATGRLLTPSTRFQAGSVSKTVLAVVVLQSVEKGALSLHEPVHHWRPEWPEQWRPLTLHQLLSHTAGLGHWPDVPGYDLNEPLPHHDLMAVLAATPLIEEPGRRWIYSGPGYLLAASVVEAATGEPYAEVARRSVFEPAGMAATTSGRFPLADGGDVARGHHLGRAQATRPEYTGWPGTGDIWTTAVDLLHFVDALVSGRLLAPPTLEAMSAQQATYSDDSEVLPGSGYGYGVHVVTAHGHRALLHPGDNPGYRSALAWVPDQQVAVAILSNDDATDVTGWVDEALRRALPH
jgi:CubicO group peptidase (beta-lactamase class C family)